MVLRYNHGGNSIQYKGPFPTNHAYTTGCLEQGKPTLYCRTFVRFLQLPDMTGEGSGQGRLISLYEGTATQNNISCLMNCIEWTQLQGTIFFRKHF